jgi:hypothetical protein
MEYSAAAWERAMRMQDVILRAISGEISWFAAADILQMPRNLRRWRERYERWGYNGLVDRRRGPPEAAGARPPSTPARAPRLFRRVIAPGWQSASVAGAGAGRPGHAAHHRR